MHAHVHALFHHFLHMCSTGCGCVSLVKVFSDLLADPHSQNIMCTCSVLLCIAHKSHPLLVQLSQVTSRPRETDSSDYGLTDGAYI